MAMNKGLINIFKNGKQEAFYPKTIYESILQSPTGTVTLKDEIEALQEFMTSAGTKLATIAEGANKYVHPSDANTRHVTDTEKTTWNAKASTAVATTLANGLMSKEDKTKLDGVAEGANNYVHPSDANSRHVSDTEKSTWNAKAGTAVATALANGLMAKEDKTKLDGIAEGANKYVHPTTTGNKHIPAGGATGQILRYSADGTAVWGAENNTTYGIATATADGLMPKTDKAKLDGIATNANNYVHPSDANTRHVTDAEKAAWTAKETTTGAQAKVDASLAVAKKYTDTKVAEIVNTAPEALDTLKELSTALGDDPNFATTVATQIGGKVDKVEGKGLSTNDYTAAEKVKLTGIAEGANKYVHPTGAGNLHIPTGGVAGQFLKWSANGTAIWAADNNTTYGLATPTADGLMPKGDKAALDKMKLENEAMKQVLVMIANMNGYELALSATMADITAAFTELYTQTDNMQFIYGSIEPVLTL